jgi:hypothetical protein
MRHRLILAALLLASAATAGEPPPTSQRWMREVTRDAPTANGPVVEHALIHGMFASRGDRILIWSDFGVRAYAASGAMLWDYLPCPECGPRIGWFTGPVRQFVPLADGGAWLLERTRATQAGGIDRMFLRRLAPDGTIVVDRELTTLPHFGRGWYGLVADTRDAIVFWGGHSTHPPEIRWLRVYGHTADAVAAFSIPSASDPMIHWAARLPDGDVMLLVSLSGVWNICVSPGTCPPVRYAAMRLSSAAQIEWRADLASQLYGFSARMANLSPAGRVVVTDEFAPFAIQQVGSEGQISQALHVPGFPNEDDWLAGAYGLEDEEMLLVSRDGLRRLDRTGMTLDARLWGEFGAPAWLSRRVPGGVVLPWDRQARGLDASLFDATSLQAIFHARSSYPSEDRISTWYVEASSDGMVWLIQHPPQPDGPYKTFLAAFARPGSVADLRVYRDGFDP